MNSNEKEINGLENEEQTNEVINEEETVEETVEAAAEDAVEEIAEEAAEETVEETTEEAEDVTDTQPEADETENTEDVSEDENETVLEEGYEEVSLTDEEPKKRGKGALIAGIIVIAAVVAVVALVLSGVIGGNKYNKLGYPNISGRTIGEIAEGAGLELAAFLEMYELPEDMPADTEEMDAVYHMPAKVYLETMYGIDFATMKTALNIPDKTTPNPKKTVFDKIKAVFVKDEIQEINENTPWYIIEGELTVGDFSGGKLDEFKEFYGLGDEVTEETKIKEINDQINAAISQKLKEQEEAEAAAEEESKEENTENAEDATTSTEENQAESGENKSEE